MTLNKGDANMQDARAWFGQFAGWIWTSCALMIVILSLIPADSPESQIGSTWIWNYGHVLAYAALAIATTTLASRTGPLTIRRRMTLYAGLGLFAAAIELVQPLVGRDGNVRDVALGMLGILIVAGSEFVCRMGMRNGS